MKTKLNIFVFVDALGWDLVDYSGFMADVLPNRKALEMQFGYSCSAVPTILSGTTPAENGHLSLFRYAPDGSPFKDIVKLEKYMKPASFWNRGRVRCWLSKAVKRALGFTGYFQLYSVPFSRLGFLDYCEKRDLFVAGGMSPIPNLCDELRSAGVNYHISDWHLSDSENLAIGAREICAGKDFLFIYTAGLDAIRHATAPDLDAEAVNAKLRSLEHGIRRLVNAASATGREWQLTVFSDHGMTPLKKTVDVMGALAHEDLVWGRDYAACFDSTMFRVHYLRPDAKDRVHAALGPVSSDGHFLSSFEERTYGIMRDDRAFGDEIFLVNPGVQIVPSDMGVKPLNGMHGYEPAELHSLAAIMSTGQIPAKMRAVRDIFGMMTSVFKNETSNDGAKEGVEK